MNNIVNESELSEEQFPSVPNAPIVPSQPNMMPQYDGPGRFYTGPMPVATVRDADFVKTKYPGGSVPNFPLMPLAPSGNATNNAATRSIIEQENGSGGVSSLLLETNGIKNVDQSTLNLQEGSNVTITSDGVGNVEISASSGSSIPQWPLPNTALTFMARAIVGTTGLQTIGDASTAVQNGGPTSISNGALPTAGLGVALPFTVGSGAGSGFNGWFPVNSSNNSSGIFWAGRNNKFQARAAFTAGASIVCFLGFSTATPSTMRTFPFIGATEYLGLYTPGINSSDTWHATINGTSVDTGVAVTGSFYFEIIMNDTANTTSFSVNGSSPVVISGSNPSGFSWFPVVSFAVNSSSTIAFDLEYFYAQQDF